MPAERETIPIAGFEKGEQPDFGDNVSIPAWYRLINLYYNSPDELRGRPHRVTQYTNSAHNGLARSPKNALIRLADGNLYVGNSLVDTMDGTGDLVYAHMHDRTILAAGSTAYVLNEAGDTLTSLSHSNIYVVETGQGAFNMRAVFVSSDDKRQAFYSVWMSPDDIGTLITATEANDEYTEGGYLEPVDYDIIDIHKFAGEWVIFTLQCIYRVTLNTDEQGFDPTPIRAFDINIRNIRPVRLGTMIVFWSDKGLWSYSIGENGPTIQPFNTEGIYRTLADSVVDAEARLTADETRGLLFVKPSNSAAVTHVFNFNRNAWTRWDWMVEHAITIGQDTYAVKYADGKTYLLDEADASEEEPYDFTIQSGLWGFGDPRLRKRWAHIGLSVVHDEIMDLALEVIADNIVPNYTPISQVYQPEISRIEQETSAWGRRGSILIQGENRGNLIIPVNDVNNPPIFVDTLIKKPRIPKDLQNAAD